MAGRYLISFSGSGLISAGSFLNYAGLPSNTVPFLVPESSRIVALSSAANGIQISTAFSILQNGSSVYSFIFTNQQFIYLNGIFIPLNVNDQISVSVSGISVLSSFALNLFVETLG